jgi:hypothetical protein
MTKEIYSAKTGIVWVRVDIPGTFLLTASVGVWSKMFKKIICRALQDKGILADSPNSLDRTQNAPVCGSLAVGAFYVSDMREGLPACRAELESLTLLDHSQIAWSDTSEGVFRYWHPSGLVGSIVNTGEVLAELQKALDAMRL